MADYTRPALNHAVAADIVELAETFVSTIKDLQFSKAPEPPTRNPSSGSSFEPF